jgi:glycosyltransferase involved in cell wall biosynthesis
MVSIRVVHVAPTAFGATGLFGGGERYPIELARALARQDDVDCELVTFGRRASSHLDPSGLRVRVLATVGHLRHHPAHPVAPGLMAALGRPDLVHTHQLRSAPSRLAATVCRLRPTAVVTTDHGLGGGGWWGLLPRMFDGFLAVSRFSADTLGAPPAKTSVIYGGADPLRFHPDPATGRAGVLFVGRITPHKGLDRLIPALPPGVELTVVGTAGHDRRPPERDYLYLVRRLAAGRTVRFLGAASEERLPLLYRQAAVVVLPSVERTCYGRPVPISELLGLCLLEAMASGTPVIASRIGGLPEIVVDGETGFLTPPGDVESLQDRLATVLADRRLARSLGDAARSHATDRFTWDACARRCLSAYQRTRGRQNVSMDIGPDAPERDR